MFFGEYLKSLRINKGISFVDFIKELKVSKTYIVDIEKGRIKPPTKKLQLEIVKILALKDEEKDEFYNKAAIDRNELPADIVEFIALDLCNLLLDDILQHSSCNTPLLLI